MELPAFAPVLLLNEDQVFDFLVFCANILASGAKQISHIYEAFKWAQRHSMLRHQHTQIPNFITLEPQ